MSKYLETDSSIATRDAAATAAVRKTPGMMMTMMTTMIPVVTVMRMKCSSLLSDRDLTRDQNLLFSRRKRSCFGSIFSIRFSPTSGPGDSFLRIRWMTPECHGTTVTSPGTWGPWEYMKPDWRPNCSLFAWNHYMILFCWFQFWIRVSDAISHFFRMNSNEPDKIISMCAWGGLIPESQKPCFSHLKLFPTSCWSSRQHQTVRHLLQ